MFSPFYLASHRNFKKELCTSAKSCTSVLDKFALSLLLVHINHLSQLQSRILTQTRVTKVTVIIV